MSMSKYASSADYWKAQAEANAKDAERYRKWRAALTSTRDEDVMHKLADAWEPEAVDAVLDAAPAVGAA